MKRRSGYYWVNLFGEWYIGQFYGNFETIHDWQVNGEAYMEEEFDEIDEKQIIREQSVKYDPLDDFYGPGGMGEKAI
jgi:hypothetical protein